MSDEDLKTFFRVLQDMPNRVTDERIFAYIQNKMNGTGIYKPSEEVKLGRKQKEKKEREAYGLYYREVKPKNWFQRLFSKN